MTMVKSVTMMNMMRNYENYENCESCENFDNDNNDDSGNAQRSNNDQQQFPIQRVFNTIKLEPNSKPIYATDHNLILHLRFDENLTIVRRKS